MTISGSTLSADTTGDGSGGALYNDGGTVSITTSLLTGDSTLDGTGGAVDNSTGTMTVTDSTLSHNSAYYSLGGGAVFNGATMTIGDSTLYGNSATYAGEGGAVHNAGTLGISASTLSHNGAEFEGGGLFGPATVVASILAENTTGGNCSQSVTDAGDNLADDDTCGFTATTDINDTASGLAPGGPAANGGPTKTIALETGQSRHGRRQQRLAVRHPRSTRRLPTHAVRHRRRQPGAAPQVITSPDTATATVGSPFSFTITTTGVPVPSIKRDGRTAQTPRLVENGNGTATIAGTPVKAGVSSFSVDAIYSKGVTKTLVTQTFTLTVVNAH